MINLRPCEPTVKDRKCGNCFFHKIKSVYDDYTFAPGLGPGCASQLFMIYKKCQWTGPWVCKSPLANPDKKDPKEGDVNIFERPACEFWD